MDDQLQLILSAFRAADADLRELRLTGSERFRQTRSSGPIFLFTRAGEALIDLAGDPRSLPIRRGSFAALPHGSGFELSVLPPNETVTLLVGEIGVDRSAAGSSFQQLPSLLFMCPSRTLGVEWHDATFAMIEESLLSDRIGARAVVQRLLESLFAITVQRHAEGAPDKLAAGRTERSVGRALLLMQDRPWHDWTVVELAETAALSPSAFARQFRKLVGASPMAHLARLRMDRAAQMLSGPDAKVADVARRLGYHSQSAFSRAFRRHHGSWPSDHRKAVRPDAFDRSTGGRHCAQRPS